MNGPNFREIFKILPTPIIIIEGAKRIEWFNDSACELAKKIAPDHVGWNEDKSVPDWLAEDLAAMGEGVDREYTFKHRFPTSAGPSCFEVFIRPIDKGRTLVSFTDFSCLLSKERGRGKAQVLSQQMDAPLVEDHKLSESMEHAMQRGEFFLEYQPQIELASGSIVGLEALLRWQHPEHGLLTPCMFLPLAEQNGLILPINEWVIRNACECASRWQREGKPLRIAVNLTSRQFRQPGLVEFIGEVINATGIAPSLLELELTESIIMENVEQMVLVLGRLRELGVTLAIDDFGTGYSSLSHLKMFPLNRLKIDCSFIRDIPGNLDDSVIAEAVIALAHTLGIGVVAEGVEKEEQLNFLRDRSCDEIQGFFISKALSAQQVSVLLGQSIP